MIHDVHAFRGEYIDLCAQIEQWATEMLRSSSAAKTGRVDAKLPYLFGHKLGKVSELATYEADVFAKPSRVVKLMADFAPFAKMRSELAHATVSVAVRDSDTLYLFELPDTMLPAVNPARFWLSPQEAATILTDLKIIKKLILDQRLKVTPKASPNPQPRPCRASSPPSASDISAPSHS